MNRSDAVVIRPGGDRAALTTEVFPVPRATAIRMIGSVAILDPANRSAEAAEPGDPAPPPDLTRGVRQFLECAGVSFGDVTGSSLAYDGSTIIVTQTARNHARIRTLLRRYSEVRQVQIEAKFMDVQQGALDELGVQWNAGRRPVALVDPQTGAPLINAAARRRFDSNEQYSTADPAQRHCSQPNAGRRLPKQPTVQLDHHR